MYANCSRWPSFPPREMIHSSADRVTCVWQTLFYTVHLNKSYFSHFLFICPLTPGPIPHWIHLHRDHHDVFSLWRRLLLWVCQLQCPRGDRSSPPDLQSQPPHQGSPNQLEPHGMLKEVYSHVQKGCLLSIIRIYVSEHEKKQKKTLPDLKSSLK